jgi:hypothetical protein
MPIYVDDNKTNLWRSTFFIRIRYTQNKFYDDLLLLFCDTIFIFVINFRAKTSSLGTYDENGDFITDDIPFCDESERRHEQIVTDCNISSSVEQAYPDDLPDNANVAERRAYEKHCNDSLDVSCLMLATMSPDLQKQYEHVDAYTMIEGLRGCWRLIVVSKFV